MKTLIKTLAVASVFALTAFALVSATAAEPKADAKTPRLVELGSDKCIPCKAMAPILADLKSTYAGQLRVDFIDVRKDPKAAKPYKINLIPTQIFFDASGKEVFRHEGFFAKEDILKKWKELGIELKSKAVEEKK